MASLQAYAPQTTVPYNGGTHCSPYGKNCIFTYNMDVSKSLTFKGRAMARAVSRGSLAAKARVQSRSSLCQIYGGHSGTGTGFSPSTSVLPSQFSINPPMLHTNLHIIMYYTYHKDKRVNPGNLQTKQRSCRY